MLSAAYGGGKVEIKLVGVGCFVDATRACLEKMWLTKSPITVLYGPLNVFFVVGTYFPKEMSREVLAGRHFARLARYVLIGFATFVGLLHRALLQGPTAVPYNP